MRTSILLLAALLFLAAPAEAQWGKRIKGNGNEVTETREVGAYDEIHVSHIFKVELVPGSEGSITLEGEENLLAYAMTDVSGGRLKITVEKGVQLQPSRNSEGILVRVPVEDLEEVRVSGAADLISTHEFSFPSLRVECSGAGEIRMAVRSENIRINASGASEIHLKGKTDRMEADGSGASNLYAFDLEAREVEAEVSGASNMRIQATDAMEARASGAGNIRYKGNPERMDTKSGRASNITKA